MAELFADLGVTEVINAAGTKTRIGGTRLRPEAAAAMESVAGSFVPVAQLQAAASERIAAATGADRGYVTTGASAALTLAAAACIAGDDLGVMARLPDTGGVADEIVMPRSHRVAYDHALRLAGATVVDVGTADRTLGAGATNVEPWEIADAIGEETAAVGYVARPETEPPLAEVCRVAHDHDVPVVVDAAAELPPAANLSRFVDAGADLVAFSGGKAIRGPQSTGILAGRADLVRSAALQHLDMDAVEALWDPPAALVDDPDGVPRHGIGRGFKVGREELAGLLVALEAFLDEDEADRAAEWRARCERLRDGLADAAVEVHVEDADYEHGTPGVRVHAGEGTTALVGRLQDDDPPIYVSYAGRPADGFLLNPLNLTDDEADYVAERIAALA